MAVAGLKAPRENGGVLAVPSLAQAGALLETNRERFRKATVNLGGRTLAELRSHARHDAVARGHQFLDHIGVPGRNPVSPRNRGSSAESSGLVVTGHQPELFHPGVWVKDFALYGLAQAHDLTPLDLLVDGDVAKNTAIRVPVIHADSAQVVSVPFDRGTVFAPYEERTVGNESTFASFANNAIEAIGGDCGFQPILPSLWAFARQVASRTQVLGERIAGARRLLEDDWGCQNLELPMSRLCQTEAFAWFACHLLADLPRFRQIHNDCLVEYRRARRIRSRNHPVPALDANGEWLEAPFWVWRVDQPQRERLFVRRTADSLELRRLNDTFTRLPLQSSGDMDRTVDAWQQVGANGFKVRTRALTTTLFARLFLADLFIHGIGGAMYDALTDEIIWRFYGLEPPAFLVLSATLYLPFESPPGPDRLGEVKHQLRDLWYNPDRHLSDVAGQDMAVAALCSQKEEWIQRRAETPAARSERFHVLRDLNDRLRTHMERTRQELMREFVDEQGKINRTRVMGDREYAFCLYPEATLRPFCSQFLDIRRA